MSAQWYTPRPPFRHGRISSTVKAEAYHHVKDTKSRPWLDELLEELSRTQPGVRVDAAAESLQEAGGAVLLSVKTGDSMWLGVAGPAGSCPGLRSLQEFGAAGAVLRLCPCDAANAAELRRLLAFTKPARIAGASIALIVDDPLAAAPPGVMEACLDCAVTPLFRVPFGLPGVDDRLRAASSLDAGAWAAFRQGFHQPWGLGAVCILAAPQVQMALTAGCTLITLAAEDALHEEYGSLGRSEVKTAYDRLDATYRADIEKHYLGRSFAVAGGAVRFSELELRRAALINGEIIDLCAGLFATVLRTRGKGAFDVALSFADGKIPTSPQSHLFVALEARRRKMPLSAIAPRLDVDGMPETIDAFKGSLEAHASIAAALGHRLSLRTASLPEECLAAIGRIAPAGYYLCLGDIVADAAYDAVKEDENAVTARVRHLFAALGVQKKTARPGARG